MGNSKGPDLPDKPHVSVKGYDCNFGIFFKIKKTVVKSPNISKRAGVRM